MVGGMRDLLDFLKEKSLREIFEGVMHPQAFPVVYSISCICSCIFVRIRTTSCGMPFYRSMMLGFVIATVPRIIQASLNNTINPEITDGSAFLIFSTIWMVFNIFPFDFPFTLFNTIGGKIVLSLLLGYSENVAIVYLHYIAFYVHKNASKEILITSISYLIPALYELLDSRIGKGSAKVRFFSLPVLKRYISLIVFLTMLTTEWSYGGPLLNHYALTPLFGLIGALLRILDMIFSDLKLFCPSDFIFPFISFLYKPQKRVRRVNGD